MADSELVQAVKTLYAEATDADKDAIMAFFGSKESTAGLATRMVRLAHDGNEIGRALHAATDSLREPYRIRGAIVNKLSS